MRLPLHAQLQWNEIVKLKFKFNGSTFQKACVTYSFHFHPVNLSSETFENRRQ